MSIRTGRYGTFCQFSELLNLVPKAKSANFSIHRPGRNFAPISKIFVALCLDFSEHYYQFQGFFAWWYPFKTKWSSCRLPLTSNNEYETLPSPSITIAENRLSQTRSNELNNRKNKSSIGAMIAFNEVVFASYSPSRKWWEASSSPERHTVMVRNRFRQLWKEGRAPSSQIRLVQRLMNFMPVQSLERTRLLLRKQMGPYIGKIPHKKINVGNSVSQSFCPSLSEA